jgi:hypothetical protein
VGATLQGVEDVLPGVATLQGVEDVLPGVATLQGVEDISALDQPILIRTILCPTGLTCQTLKLYSCSFLDSLTTVSYRR